MSHVTHIWMSHTTDIWMSHVTHPNESLHTHTRVMTHIQTLPSAGAASQKHTNESRHTHMNESHHRHMIESRHAPQRVTSHTYTRHDTHSDLAICLSSLAQAHTWVTSHTHKGVTSRPPTSHVTHIHESWHTLRVMSHIQTLPSASAASRKCRIDHTIGNKMAQQQITSSKCKMSRHVIHPYVPGGVSSTTTIAVLTKTCIYTYQHTHTHAHAHARAHTHTHPPVSAGQCFLYYGVATVRRIYQIIGLFCRI